MHLGFGSRQQGQTGRSRFRPVRWSCLNRAHIHEGWEEEHLRASSRGEERLGQVAGRLAGSQGLSRSACESLEPGPGIIGPLAAFGPTRLSSGWHKLETKNEAESPVGRSLDVSGLCPSVPSSRCSRAFDT